MGQGSIALADWKMGEWKMGQGSFALALTAW